MSELLILYVVFSYFFVFGMLTGCWGWINGAGKILGVLCMLVSPIGLPFAMGFSVTSEN